MAKYYATKCLPLVAEYPEPPSWFPNFKHAKDAPLSIDIKLAKITVTQLPRGYSSLLLDCVYLAEFMDADKKPSARHVPNHSRYR